MANYLRNQLAKVFSKYFKNISPEQFTLKFFRGEAELENLEMRPEVLQQLLGLPPWLILRKASIGSIRAVVTWTKIKSTPVRIIIDEMQLKLEVTGTPTADDFAHLDLKEYGFSEEPKKKEKYGFIDGVIDGVQLEIGCIDVTVVAPDFLGTLHIIHVSVKSCDQNWEPCSDLKQSRVEDKAKDTITLFKLLKIHELRGVISPMTPRISEAAQSDPFTFNISEPQLRIFKKKSMNDNSKTLKMHVTLDINLIKQELSRFQIQTLQHMVDSTTKMMDRTRGMNFYDTPETQDNVEKESSLAEHGFHVKIKTLELRLKNHIAARAAQNGAEQYLTSLLITNVTIHHFAEQIMGVQLLSKNALRQAYLSECSKFTTAVNSSWAKSANCSKSYIKHNLRQAATSMTIGNVKVVTLRAVSNEERVKQKRASSVANARASVEPDSAEDHSLITLLDKNFSEYHLPKDLDLVQIDMVSYFNVENMSASRTTSPASPQTNTPTPSTSRPPPVMFARVNPVKLQLNVAAILQLVDFANSCKLGTPVITENIPVAVEQLGIQISLCTTVKKMDDLNKEIQELSNSPRSTVSPDAINELKRVFAIRMESLASAEETDKKTDDGEDFGFVRYSIELSLPTLCIPNLQDGPSRVRDQELRFICSRATITNCMQESRFIGVLNFDEFYNSPLVTPKGSTMTAIPLNVHHEDHLLHPLPQRSWLPAPGNSHSASTTHINIDQIWGDLYKTVGAKKVWMMRPAAISVWMLDTTESLKTLSNEEDKNDNVDALNSSLNYATSYTLVSLPQKLELEVTNSLLLFITRFLDQFSRLSHLLDDGNDKPRKFMFLSVNEISVSLFAEKHMLHKASRTFIAEQEATGFKKAFHNVTINRLHQATYSGQRGGVQLLAIETISLNKQQPQQSPKKGVQPTTSSGKEWEHISIALRGESKMPSSPEHAYMYYQQLDKILLHKEVMEQIAFEKRMREKPDLALKPSTSPTEGKTPTKKFSLMMRMAMIYRENRDSPPSYNDIKSTLVSEFGQEEFEENKASITRLLQTLAMNETRENSQSKKGTTPALSPIKSSADDFTAIDVASSPLGNDANDTNDRHNDSTVTSPSPSEQNVSTMSAVSDMSDMSESFELNHLPQPVTQIELQNLNIALNSDDVAMFGSFTDDYFPDDVGAVSSLTITITDTRVSLVDVQTIETKSLEAFRLITPEDTSRQQFHLDGVKVTKRGKSMKVENISGPTQRKDLKKDELVERLQNELAQAQATLRQQEQHLGDMTTKLRLAGKRESTLLDALEHKQRLEKQTLLRSQQLDQRRDGEQRQRQQQQQQRWQH
eukprot:m.245761 g.245761  ORF g.245761 m.245761 type:complete len:1323 (-) comp33839_c4_seq2:1453-5421(-)